MTVGDEVPPPPDVSPRLFRQRAMPPPPPPSPSPSRGGESDDDSRFERKLGHEDEEKEGDRSPSFGSEEDSFLRVRFVAPATDGSNRESTPDPSEPDDAELQLEERKEETLAATWLNTVSHSRLSHLLASGLIARRVITSRSTRRFAEFNDLRRVNGLTDSRFQRVVREANRLGYTPTVPRREM